MSMVFAGGYARFTDVLARQLLAAGAGLVLPIYTGGRLRGQVEEAEAAALFDVEIAEAELRLAVAAADPTVPLEHPVEIRIEFPPALPYARAVSRIEFLFVAFIHRVVA